MSELHASPHVDKNVKPQESGAIAQPEPAAPPQPSPNPTTKGVYKAPYHRNHCTIPGSYIVSFYKRHTIAKHFAFLNRDFKLTDLGSERTLGYYADLDDELLGAVRGDLGVKFVEDNTYGEEE